MPYVSGHYRRDGTYVRPHYRRSTPRSAQGTGHIRVGAHYRADGTYVRSYWRNTTPTQADGSSFSDWSWLWYLLVALLVLAALGSAS